MLMLTRALVVAFAVLVTLALCEQHTNLHHATRHQSSLNSAKHRSIGSFTNDWIVKLTSKLDAHKLVDSINSQLGETRATLANVLHTDIAVVNVEQSSSSTHNVVVVLMSEQRAGNIKWFQRDGETKRKSH